MKIHRYIYTSLLESIHTGKTILIYGPRQAGKTTIVQTIYNNHTEKKISLTSDYISDMQWLMSRDRVTYNQYLHQTTLLIIDEAQNIPDIGIILKTIHDNFPDCQIIATGSSSFDLAQRTQEPLTGRKIVFHLFPLGIHELYTTQTYPAYYDNLGRILTYGLYPGIFTLPDIHNARASLQEIVHAYLFKDILHFEGIKKSDTIVKLTTILAYQIGKLVSYSELSNKLGISIPTVEKYCTILEQAYIIFRLSPYSKNLRKEVTKTNKIYFWDIGIRNALINNHQDIDIRGDKGEIRENCVIAEMMKKNLHTQQGGKYYFWRTYDDQEVDLIYQYDENIIGYEIKRSEQKKYKIPQAFATEYPTTPVHIVHHRNFLDFL